MSTVGAFSAAGSASFLAAPGPANRDSAPSTDVRLSRSEVGLAQSRDAQQVVRSTSQSEQQQDSKDETRRQANLPGSRDVKPGLLGFQERKQYPDYDPKKAAESRAKAIGEMVDRFEEVLSRIDKYIGNELNLQEQSSLHSKSGDAPSRVLDALVGTADSLFEGLISRSKRTGDGSPTSTDAGPDALNVVL